jgi:hypothetical protein
MTRRDQGKPGLSLGQPFPLFFHCLSAGFENGGHDRPFQGMAQSGGLPNPPRNGRYFLDDEAEWYPQDTETSRTNPYYGFLQEIRRSPHFISRSIVIKAKWRSADLTHVVPHQRQRRI